MKNVLLKRLACTTALLMLVPATFVEAQARQGPRARRNAAEVQRLFDAYTLAQAQDALKLTDAQYPEFVTRMKALQDVRHRNQQARLQLLREIDRLTGRGAGEAELRDGLKALREHDARAAADLQKAYAELDEVLDTRQQARFRLFEESMERKKLDLLMRARQRGRARLEP
jgi:hypothetical protein